MSFRKIILIVLLLIACSVVGYFVRPWIDQVLLGQAMKKDTPELNTIYQRTAQLENVLRNPVIVVPGMMGSKLRQNSTGRIVWGVFDEQSIDSNVDADIRLLGCPIDGADLDRFDDGVHAAGVLDSLQVNIVGLSLRHQAYLNILRMLGVGGYRDEELGLSGAVDYGDQHFTCFQFPYDWRRDNAENARRLHQFLLEKKKYVEAERKRRYGTDEPVKFDIVAHSMGGLVSRYYLRYGDQGPAIGQSKPELNWAGCQFVDRLIMIGTPNNGSAKSLVSTHDGFSFSVIFGSFPSGLVATLPSIYQLLPNGPDPCVFDSQTNQPLNHFDVDVWDRRGWGMLNPDQAPVLKQLLPNVASADQRREIAKNHVANCLYRAAAFHNALNIPAQPPAHTSIHVFAGDSIATVDTLFSDLTARTLTTRSEVPGDHTVTRKSVLADQRTEAEWGPKLSSPIHFNGVQFLFDDHFGLTRDAEFTDNALFLLLEDPTKSSSFKLPNRQ